MLAIDSAIAASTGLRAFPRKLVPTVMFALNVALEFAAIVTFPLLLLTAMFVADPVTVTVALGSRSAVA